MHRTSARSTAPLAPRAGSKSSAPGSAAPGPGPRRVQNPNPCAVPQTHRPQVAPFRRPTAVRSPSNSPLATAAGSQAHCRCVQRRLWQQSVRGNRLGQLQPQPFSPVIRKLDSVRQHLGRRHAVQHRDLPNHDAHRRAIRSQREHIARPDIRRIRRLVAACYRRRATRCKAQNRLGRELAIHGTPRLRLQHLPQPTRRSRHSARRFSRNPRAILQPRNRPRLHLDTSLLQIPQAPAPAQKRM